VNMAMTMTIDAVIHKETEIARRPCAKYGSAAQRNRPNHGLIRAIPSAVCAWRRHSNGQPAARPPRRADARGGEQIVRAHQPRSTRRREVRTPRRRGAAGSAFMIDLSRWCSWARVIAGASGTATLVFGARQRGESLMGHRAKGSDLASDQAPFAPR
jgi:hypothetical protein